MTQGKSPQGPGKFDFSELRRLLTLMEKHGLAEVELEQEGKRVHLVRNRNQSPTVPMAAHPVAVQPAAAAAPEAAADAEKRGIEIPSPMVGTFYRAPSPDAASFAEVGDRITADSVVCIVEAMKVMNEIKAEIAGEILEILVQNGEPVEFGQPLFLVKN